MTSERGVPSESRVYVSTIGEFSTTKQLVLELLKTDGRCRNDDKYLTYRVFQEIAMKNGKKIFLPFDLFEKFPAFESVKRVRASIQNVEGLYPPTNPETIAKRQQRQRAVRDWVIVEGK